MSFLTLLVAITFRYLLILKVCDLIHSKYSDGISDINTDMIHCTKKLHRAISETVIFLLQNDKADKCWSNYQSIHVGPSCSGGPGVWAVWTETARKTVLCGTARTNRWFRLTATLEHLNEHNIDSLN